MNTAVAPGDTRVDASERIMNAMRKLALENHYSEIRVIDLLHEAEVSASSFYLRFTGKDAVFESMFRRYCEDSRNTVVAMATEVAVRGLRPAVIEDVLYAYAFHVLDWHGVKRVVASTPKWRRASAQLDQDFLDAVARYLRTHHGAVGMLDATEFVELLRMLAAAISQMIDDALLLNGRATIDDARMRSLTTTVVRLLSAEDPAPQRLA